MHSGGSLGSFQDQAGWGLCLHGNTGGPVGGKALMSGGRLLLKAVEVGSQNEAEGPPGGLSVDSSPTETGGFGLAWNCPPGKTVRR